MPINLKSAESSVFLALEPVKGEPIRDCVAPIPADGDISKLRVLARGRSPVQRRRSLCVIFSRKRAALRARRGVEMRRLSAQEPIGSAIVKVFCGKLDSYRRMSLGHLDRNATAVVARPES